MTKNILTKEKIKQALIHNICFPQYFPEDERKNIQIISTNPKIKIRMFINAFTEVFYRLYKDYKEIDLANSGCFNCKYFRETKRF